MSSGHPFNRRIYERISFSMDVTECLYRDCTDDIIAAAELLIACFKSGNKLLLCGNGGSAADCQHLATEFMSSGFPAIALTTDTSFLTAWSNDHSYDSVFERQVNVLGKDGDVLLAISTSGQSRNVLMAIGAALRRNIQIIFLTGQYPDGTCHVSIKIPSTNTQYIQESHIMVEHILWELVRDNQG